jgi:hypothetical protein
MLHIKHKKSVDSETKEDRDDAAELLLLLFLIRFNGC